MRKVRVLIVFVYVMASVNIASADIIRGINIDFVAIGNAGNTGDTRIEASPDGCGAVGYNYHIGKYEVTNTQWNTFTAAAGAPTGSPGMAYDQSAYFTGVSQPTNNVSWYEATQFCNYLTSGDKSKGAYLYSGNNTNPGSFLSINKAAAQTIYGTIYVLPTKDEWYKAAYYKPDGSGYSTYANGTNTAPSTSQACYSIYSSPWDFGSGTMEQNGTFDMMGNVNEWNEDGSHFRGGQYASYDTYFLSSSSWHLEMPYSEIQGLGFRIVSIPEPATILLLTLGGLALRKHRR